MRVAMIEPLATAVVLLAGLYLACLGAVALVAPALARRFLLGFARSRALHYLELTLRLIVGGAFLLARRLTVSDGIHHVRLGHRAHHRRARASSVAVAPALRPAGGAARVALSSAAGCGVVVSAALCCSLCRTVVAAWQTDGGPSGGTNSAGHLNRMKARSAPAGYSGKPLVEKLGIKPGACVSVMDGAARLPRTPRAAAARTAAE